MCVSVLYISFVCVVHKIAFINKTSVLYMIMRVLCVYMYVCAKDSLM